MSEKFTITIKPDDMLDAMIELALYEQYGDNYVETVGNRHVQADIDPQDSGDLIVSVEVSEVH